MRDDGTGGSISPKRRPGRCTVALAATVLAMSLLSVELSAAMLAAGPPPPGAADGTVTLTDDDGGSAMFHAEDLVPGRPVTRCIAVSYTAGGDPAEVRLFADAAGDLRRHLNLVVEVGSGGGFRDCTGFRGAVVYDGTLDRFVTAHGAAETSLPTLSTSGGPRSRVFRFTLEPRGVAAAQGRTATATFTWLLDAAAQPPPAQAGPAAEPAVPRPRLGAGDRPASPGTDAGPVAAGVQLAPAASANGEVGRRAASSGTDPRPTPAHGEPTAAVARSRDGGLADLLAALGRMLAAVAERSVIPVLLLVVMLLFVAVQDRIDRGDPKLAQAPIERHPDLEFRPLSRRRISAS